MTRAKTGPQTGITNRPPGHLLLVALTFAGDRSPATARAAVEALRAVVCNELESDLDDQDAGTAKNAPGPETGELGFEDDYNRYFLTITFGVSKTGFDALGVPAEEQPADLVPIPWSDLGNQPPSRPDGTPVPDGDLILQICGDNVYVNQHVVRRIEEELGGQLTVAWTQAGVQRHTSRAARTSRREGRGLIGFHDGTANLDPRHDPEDAELVFVDPGKVSAYPPLPSAGGDQYTGPGFPAGLRPPPPREPEWTAEGTYMVVRSSVTEIAGWDRLSLGEQEAIIGRFKFSGASLDLVDDPRLIDDAPAYASDQNDVRVALASHARKTGPRRVGSDDDARRIFRRGYPLVEATQQGVRRGLVFVCFGRTISSQFEFMVRAWMNNPNFPTAGAGVDRIQAFDHIVLSGGYYFVPRLEKLSEPWSWYLPPTA